MATAKQTLTQNDQSLLRSAEKGELEGVKKALTNGAKVSISDEGLNTALHLSSYRGHKDCVHHLVHNGADANLGNENQDIPVHLAALANRSNVLEVLLDPSCPTKSNLDAQDAQGYCPLHYACGEGHVESAELLLKKYGARTDCRNMDGLTPLMCSVQQGHIKIASLLLAADPTSVSHVNNSKDTSLHYAMISDAGIPMVDLLLRSGADPEAKNNEGHTPLVEAVIEKKIKCAEHLQEVTEKLRKYPGYDQFNLVSQRAAALNLILDGKWKPEGGGALDGSQTLPVPATNGSGERTKLKFSSARAGMRVKTSVEVAREEFQSQQAAPKPKPKSRIFTPGSSSFNF